MSFFTRAATTALTGLVIFGFASAAFAGEPLPREGSLEAHALLVQVVKDAGVDFVVNHPHCQEVAGINGFYSGKDKLLVVCNDRYIPVLNENPQWTENDLDTLRHEAQHFIQDCMVGTNHDHWLNSVYKDPKALARAVLSDAKFRGITRSYRERGASDHILNMEYEAFAVAAMNKPLEQAQDLVKACGVSY